MPNKFVQLLFFHDLFDISQRVPAILGVCSFHVLKEEGTVSFRYVSFRFVSLDSPFLIERLDSWESNAANTV